MGCLCGRGEWNDINIVRYRRRHRRGGFRLLLLWQRYSHKHVKLEGRVDLH